MSDAGLYAQLAFFTVDDLDTENNSHFQQDDSITNGRALEDQKSYFHRLPLEIMLSIEKNSNSGSLYFTCKRWSELLEIGDKHTYHRQVKVTKCCSCNDALAETEWNDSHGRLRWLLKQPWLTTAHFTDAYHQHVDDVVRDMFEQFFILYPISKNRLHKKIRPRFERVLARSFLHNPDTWLTSFAIQGVKTDKGHMALEVSHASLRRGGMYVVHIDIGLYESTSNVQDYSQISHTQTLARIMPPVVANHHTLPLSLLRGPWDMRRNEIITAFVIWFWSGKLPVPLSKSQLSAGADGLQATMEQSMEDAIRYLPSVAFSMTMHRRADDLIWDAYAPWLVLTSMDSDGHSHVVPVPVQTRHVRTLANAALHSSEKPEQRHQAMEIIAAYLALDPQLCDTTILTRKSEAGSIPHSDCNELLGLFQLLAASLPRKYQPERRSKTRIHFVRRKQSTSGLTLLLADVARVTGWLKTGHLDVDPDDEAWKERAQNESSADMDNLSESDEQESVTSSSPNFLSPHRYLPLRPR